MASNSKDYYKMRFGQMNFDPTENNLEEQSVFDAMAMDYGAPFESTAVSRKQVREENEKGTTLTETETGEDGSSRQFKSFFPTQKENPDGLFVVGSGPEIKNKSLQAEKGANKRQQEQFTSILDQLAREKDDSYFSPPIMGMINDPSSTTQWLDGQTHAERDEAIAAGEALRASGIQESPGGDDHFLGAYASTSPGGDDHFWGADASLGIQESPGGDDHFGGAQAGIDAEREREELFKLENPKEWSDEFINNQTSKENTDKNAKILASSAAAKESLELLRDELKELQDNPEAKQEAYMDFLRENGALKEWRADLYKALIGAAFGMLMGEDIDDAFYNSFGAMEEAKMLEEERAHELEVQKAKDAGKSGASLYSTKAEKFNVGTDAKPIMVTGVQIREGVTGLEDKAGQWLITYPDGKKVIMERNTVRGDGSLKPFLQPWYTQTQSQEIVDKNMNQIIELTKSSIARFQGEHDDKDAVKALDANILAQAELIPKMVEAHQHQGISFGPQMDPSTRGFVANVLKDYLEYKYINEKGRKTLGNFWDDAMLRADMSLTIPDEAWQWQENYIPLVDNPKNKPEESGEQPEKFYTEAISAVYKYMGVLENSGLEKIEYVDTNSDKFKLAWGMFQKWQEDTDKGKVDANHDVAWEQGYTPFVYWLITKASK